MYLPGDLVEVLKQLTGVGAPVGFQNSGYWLDLGLHAARRVFVDEAAEDRLALDPLLGEVGDGMVRPGRRSRRLR